MGGGDAGRLDRVFEAEDPVSAREYFEELARELESEADAALDTLEAGLEDTIAGLGYFRTDDDFKWGRQQQAAGGDIQPAARPMDLRSGGRKNPTTFGT